ncbi:MAG: hypothetical protein K0R63_1177 [Rickettsiales bacterium]|jgi:phosphate-selective porin OprO/OprP|nr:hypothetical protein [Rickettsiales bacterium]
MKLTRKALLTGVALTPFLFPYSSFAATDSERIETLEKQIELLQREIKSLKTEQKQAVAPAAASPVSAPASKASKAETKAEAVSVTLDPLPTFKSADGDFSFAFSGGIQADAGWFNDDNADYSNGTTLRRARIGFKGTAYHDWDYAFQVETAHNELQLLDSYIRYKGFENVAITAGQHKEAISLEQLSGSFDLTFAESASLTAFTPERHIGVSTSTWGDQWSLHAGVFGEGAGDVRADDEGSSVTTRATYAPINEKDGLTLHVGAAGSYRTPDNETDSVRYRYRPMSRLADSNAVDTGTINDVDDVTLGALEFAGQYKNAYVQSEFLNTHVERSGVAGGGGADLSAWYVQASYVLTGESRSYSVSKGLFSPIKPKSPFSRENGTWGAWEVSVRYGGLDLNDAFIQGGKMDSTALALNWYALEHLRFLASYEYVDTDATSVVPNDNPSIITLRAQFDF